MTTLSAITMATDPEPGTQVPPEMPPPVMPPLPGAPPEVIEPPPTEPTLPVREPGKVIPVQAAVGGAQGQRFM